MDINHKRKSSVLTNEKQRKQIEDNINDTSSMKNIELLFTEEKIATYRSNRTLRSDKNKVPDLTLETKVPNDKTSIS